MIWFLSFQNAELQHAFSTKIMGWIWMNPGTYGYFFPLIPMVWKFLEFSPCLRYFSHLKDWRFLSIKDCVLYEWKIAGSFILKDCLFFQNERIKQSFKIKESCNLSFIEYAIFDWNKSILFTRKIDQIFQFQRTKRSFRCKKYHFEYWNKILY